MVALESTSCRCPIATPLHQPALHYLSEGLMGSADAWKDVEQLQPLVRRVEVEQRDRPSRTHLLCVNTARCVALHAQRQNRLYTPPRDSTILPAHTLATSLASQKPRRKSATGCAGCGALPPCCASSSTMQPACFVVRRRRDGRNSIVWRGINYATLSI